MKKLEDFQAEQIDLKSITGGIGGPATGPHVGTSLQKASDYDDCCWVATDVFYDHNNNGIWDSYPNDGAEGGSTSNWSWQCD